ncbi:carboxylate--amine ligase [Halalkalirubrum salinum]|uniref:carboxylate--amine ligase n=1 Tax=Halalkalirubrum salinum TaxID=2563889 RepID=UPI0014857F76|nr:ATP-grasp domain-containing protein [Halalkalirubrum salinum]
MTDDTDAAIVPDVGIHSSAVAVRSLSKAGVRPIVASNRQSSPALSSKYCAETIDVPDPHTSIDAYADSLLSLAERDDVRTILPLREADVYALSKNRPSFARHMTPVWPDFETLRTVQDRRTLLSVAQDLDIPTPSTRLLTAWPDGADRAVVKPRYSIVVDEVSSAAREPAVRVMDPHERPPVDEVVDEMGHVPVVQEYVPMAGEYGFFALMDRGDPVLTFQHRRVRSFTYDGGASVYRKSIDDPTLRAYGLRLLSALEWHGPAMVEFRRDRRDDTLKLMEINPRFWGSLALAVHAGADFPRHYVDLAVENTPGPEVESYEVGLGTHLLTGELAYLYTVFRGNQQTEPPPFIRELASVLWSVYRQPQFDLCSLRDPMPFVTTLRSLTKQATALVVDPVRSTDSPRES